MYKTKIAFFGTSGWEITSRHLEEFLKNKANISVFVEAPSHLFKSTSTKKESSESLSKTAKRLGIPILAPENARDCAFARELASFKPDAIVVCGYQFYIPGEIIKIPPLGIINFHSSLLPRHAGMHPVFWTIWYGDKKTGMTVHFIDEGIDTGDIIFKTEVDVKLGDTVELLYDRIFDSSIPLAGKFLDDLENRALAREPQDYKKYFYNYEIIEKDFELDFRQPAEILAGRVLMLPGKFYFVLNGERHYVAECEVIREVSEKRKYAIGEPIKDGDGGGKLVFATPRSFFAVKKVKGQPVAVSRGK
jgi:methionyl-tRNA formyltransferase